MSAWAGVLSGAHTAMAWRTGHPHWQISDQEAKAYSIALSNALRHLPVQVAQKYTDYAALAFMFVNVEFPRAYASRQLYLEAARARASQFPSAPAFKFTNPNAPREPVIPVSANGTGNPTQPVSPAGPLSVPDGPPEPSEPPLGP